MQRHSGTPGRILSLCAIFGSLGLTELNACSGAATSELDGSSSLVPASSATSSGSSIQNGGMSTLGVGTGPSGATTRAEGSAASVATASKDSGTSSQAGDAGSGGGDAGTDSGAGAGGQGTACTPEVCPGGVCWQRLDAVEECVHAPAQVPTVTCESFDGLCCSTDTECADGTGGRCVSTRATYFGCGGAVPIGNACNYAACASDPDCVASTPRGATVAACVPAGALGLYTAACIFGGCRTDHDCTLHSGGACRFGEAATHGTCDRRRVFFCAYPGDPCASDTDCQQAGSFMVCVPEENYQGRHCAPPPPMYP